MNRFKFWFWFLLKIVVDGRLEFSYELGSGSVQIITPVRVDDGKRHRAVARRTARDGSLELDGVILENGRSPEGPHQVLNTKGNIYVGGLPNAEAMTTGRYIHGLKGCIHHLEIQESGVINFQRAALSAINVVPCSRYYDTFFLSFSSSFTPSSLRLNICDDAIIAKTIVFLNVCTLSSSHPNHAALWTRWNIHFILGNGGWV